MSTTTANKPAASFDIDVTKDMQKSGTVWYIAKATTAEGNHVPGKFKALTDKGARAKATRAARKYLREAPALAASIIKKGLRFKAEGHMFVIGRVADEIVTVSTVDNTLSPLNLSLSACATRFRTVLLSIAQPGLWKYEIEPKGAQDGDKCFDSMIMADGFEHAQQIVRDAAERLRKSKIALSGRAWLLRLDGEELAMEV